MNEKILPITEEIVDKFLSRVEKNTETGCWNWTGGTNGRGYGLLRVKYNNRWCGFMAHRLSYVLSKKGIPDGLVLDHLCRNHSCVNPDHLECVTTKENIRRGINCTKRYCKRGHPLFGENLYNRLGNQPARVCRVCQHYRAIISELNRGINRRSKDYIDRVTKKALQQ